MEKIFGRLAVLSSFYAVVIGLGSQAFSNYQRHSVDGLSLHFLVSVYILYFLWMSYGLAKPKKDYYLIVPNILGLLVGSILFYQFVAYH